MRSGPGRIRRALLFLTALIVLGLAVGAIYQAISVRREAGRYPAPGKFADVGGRKIHYLCLGEQRRDVPTVIVEPSGFGNSLSAAQFRTSLSSYTRVCSYDRVGTGWSDPGPAVTSPAFLVSDLEHLLDSAAIAPPYVFVTSSIGGFTTELFLRRHPERVAGAVFLDAADSDVLRRINSLVSRTNVAMLCTMQAAARFGILRVMDPFKLRRAQPAESVARSIAQLYTTERMSALCGMARGVLTAAEDLDAALPLSAGIPLSVLTAESTEGLVPDGIPGLRAKLDVFRDDWVTGQQEFAKRSAHGSWRLVRGSGHLISSDKPDEVIAAVLEFLSVR